MQFDGSFFHMCLMAGFTRGDVGDAYSQSSESWTPQFGIESDWTETSWIKGSY